MIKNVKNEIRDIFQKLETQLNWAWRDKANGNLYAELENIDSDVKYLKEYLKTFERKYNNVVKMSGETRHDNDGKDGDWVLEGDGFNKEVRCDGCG